MKRNNQILKIIFFTVFVFVSGCGGDDDNEVEVDTSSSLISFKCTGLSGSAWSPGVGSSSYHDKDTVITKYDGETEGKIIGLAQGIAESSMIEVMFEIGELGKGGSLSLIATVEDFPDTTLTGSAYPVLVSLNDGEDELINLELDGTGGDCAEDGIFSCTSAGSCSANSNCDVSSPSAYSGRTYWEQAQMSSFGYVSVNIFPTCNWETGTCDFIETFNPSGELKSGTYTAKYVLMASDYASISGYTAKISVTAITKKDTTELESSGNGALDINVILVGEESVNAARTKRGKENLDSLFSSVNDHYNQSGSGIKIGNIEVTEWCNSSSEEYADVDLEDLDELFESTSLIEENGGLNLFFVSSIVYEENYNVLGVAGSIPGALINGTGASGVVISLFDELDTLEEEDESFKELATTVSHEMGHLLGLYHPTESNGTDLDPIPDTPHCGKTGKYVTHDSCISTVEECELECSGYNGKSTFCPEVEQCQFNHIMWWTTKNIGKGSYEGEADGNLFSEQTSFIINVNPLIY